MKILLVEDNLLNQKVVIFSLKKYNFEIISVTHGIDALDQIKNNSFDLILMDLMLPDMSGYEITIEIRRLEKENGRNNPIPIIALTANTLDNDRDKCFESGMNEYLSKPFNEQELVEKISNFKKSHN